jgi:hypothetical protein
MWQFENADIKRGFRECRNPRVLYVCDAVFHPVTGALDDDRLGVVQDTVEDGRGQRGVVVEDVRPVLVGLVGRDHRGALFVALAEHLEEQVRAELVDRQVSEFVDHQQRRARVAAQFLTQALRGLRRSEGVYDVDRRREEHAVPLFAGVVTERCGQVGLAHADAADEDYIGMVFEEGHAEQVLDLDAVDFFRPAPVEAGQFLPQGEARRLDAAGAAGGPGS